MTTYEANELLIQDFLLYFSVYRRPATIECYKNALRHFLRWLHPQDKLITGLTTMDFPKYVAYMAECGFKDGTKAINVTAIKSVWRWLYENERVPFGAERIKTPERLDVQSHETMNREEFVRMVAVYSEYIPQELRSKLIITLLFATGVRLGELLSMDVSDVSLEKMSATVRTFKRKKHVRKI